MTKKKPDTRVTWTEKFVVEFNRGDVPFHLLREIQERIAAMEFNEHHWQDFGPVDATITSSVIEDLKEDK